MSPVSAQTGSGARAPFNLTAMMHMSSSLRPIKSVACLVLCAGSVFLSGANAQSAGAAPAPGTWRYSATIYGYLPSMGGTTSFPADASGTPINVSVDKILDNLKMTFMGALDAHNGSWGGFTDVLYMDIGNGKSQSRDFTIGNVGLPAETTARLDLDLKAVIWTLAGEYRLVSTPVYTLDMLAGARMADVKQRLRWDISGSLGSIDASRRTGSIEVDQTVWDGIVGVKGRYAFGDSRQWSVPFYLDVGAGDSDLTWQAATGISYAFKWGDLSAVWRYLDYDMKSGKSIQSLNFSGPMIGASLHW